MDLPIVSAVTGIGEKNGVPLAFQPRREFFGKFTTTRGKESRKRASLLCLSVIARVRTSPSLSSDCFFAFGGVYYSVEIHSLHVYLNTRYKHVVNEIEV